MNCTQIESNKVSYMRKLVKTAKSNFTLDSANKAINYGIKYMNCLERSGEIVEMLKEAEQLKQDIIQWQDSKDSIILADRKLQSEIQESLHEQGLSNNYKYFYI